MGRRAGSEATGTRRGWLLPALLLVLIALVAGVGAGYLVVREDDAEPPAAAASPTPTPARDVPLPSRDPLLAAGVDAPVPTTAGLARVVAAALRQPALGGRIAAAVIDARTGEVLLDNRGATSVTPASTSKIVTAAAALTVLEPDARLTTRIVAGAVPGQVVVVGGGDPTLVGSKKQPDHPPRARVSDLVAQARAALGATPVTSVVVDTSLYGGPVLGPGWKTGYVSSGDVAPVTSLMVDAGRVSADGPRTLTPAALAGRRIAALLGAPKAPVTVGRAAPDAVVLGEVRSPTIAQLVEVMLTRSDNDLAEALARQVAIARGLPATFDGAAVAVDRVIDELLPGIAPADIATRDGSGLSRVSRVGPLALSRLISVAAADQTGRLAPLLSGLPVAGFDGTLVKRFRAGPSAVAAGAVRGKTGTLNGVSALAGTIRTAEGRLLAFDLTADAVPPGANGAAQVALDVLAASIASCGCR
jgi:D-alanyl-D-alanine carboxypeptidase/D-alanyl-D-alanine-endopeptidase (penicillin-binding protein 4)